MNMPAVPHRCTWTGGMLGLASARFVQHLVRTARVEITFTRPTARFFLRLLKIVQRLPAATCHAVIALTPVIRRRIEQNALFDYAGRNDDVQL